MKILIFEDNLMWAPRLAKSIRAFGDEPHVISKLPEEIPEGDLAIVNLGSQSMPAATIVPLAKAAGIPVLAHAGHKEKELLALGDALGCDRLATNGEITHKLEAILVDFRQRHA